jgi:hypothetical protein
MEPKFRNASTGDPTPEEEAPLRHERRDERMHVRVHLPFTVNLGGKRYAGHDISVSGLSTEKRPPIELNEIAGCDIEIRCAGFRATIPATIRMLGTRPADQGARFEIIQIGDKEAAILRRLIRANLAGVHLSVEQLAVNEDPQTVRDRVKKTIQPPNPTPSLVRFGVTLFIIAVLHLVLAAALYEHLFVIKPDFAAVTAPEIRIHAPIDGVLAAHDLDPSDGIKRDQLLAEVRDPEISAQLTLAEATLNYNEHLLKTLRESLDSDNSGKATVISAGPAADGVPVLTRLTPLERRARVKEFETSYSFAQAKLTALRARHDAGTIFAPCECTIYSIRSGVGGYWVQKGALIARLISNNTDDVAVEALVHLNTIRGIEPNERAEVVMPTTGETRSARVTSVQLEGQKIERAGFPEWARQDMSHGTVILAMEEPLPTSLVGHPVEVRFIDTDSAVGEAVAAVLKTFNKLLHRIGDQVSSAVAEEARGPRS